ncbi:hypothetical protein BDV33DRAFT_186288 [Aspergillus novoparasiticus]|uniref:Uncharacterized protein n=1 Tax=Aspergillus novoparasiticus TaxID=986946 RepID=A0A5N6E8F9_9EURO|nr:hypothetical protein BDV33DRAFT_186288 [Aspergillus novoparasiticus]
MQTLTTAIRPLVIHGDSQRLWSQKSSKRWNKYMKGASAMYAYHRLLSSLRRLLSCFAYLGLEAEIHRP